VVSDCGQAVKFANAVVEGTWAHKSAAPTGAGRRKAGARTAHWPLYNQALGIWGME